MGAGRRQETRAAEEGIEKIQRFAMVLCANTQQGPWNARYLLWISDIKACA